MRDAPYCDFVRVFVCVGAVAAYGTREGKRFLKHVQAHERSRERSPHESVGAWCARTLARRARAETADTWDADDNDDDAALVALYAHVRSGAISGWAREHYESLLAALLPTRRLTNRRRQHEALALLA